MIPEPPNLLIVVPPGTVNPEGIELGREQNRQTVHKELIGCFDFADLYDEQVNRAGETAHFVEVGVFAGKSAAYLANAVIDSGKAIRVDLVDTWDDTKKLGRNPIPSVEQCRENLSAFDGSLDMRFIQSDSAKAAERYENRSLDFVFIDAAHDERSVENDIWAWLPKVKSGGVIAGHDYTAKEHPGVRRAVDRLLPLAGKTSRSSWKYVVPETPRLSICVPLKASGAHRKRNWRVLANELTELAKRRGDIEIIVAEWGGNHADGYGHIKRIAGTGEFSRSRARNQAFSLASSDRICFLDSDMLMPPDDWDKAIDESQGFDCYSPYKHLYYLGPKKTANRVAGDRWQWQHPIGAPNPNPPRRTPANLSGGIFFCTREFIDSVGRWDERFKGYGAEDTALNVIAKEGDYRIGWGSCLALHMFHKQDRKGHQRNRKLFQENYLETPSRPKPTQVDPVRHLAFFLYPRNEAATQYHLDQLERSLSVFNGKKVCCVAIDDTTHFERYRERIESLFDDVFCAPNDPRLGEQIGFVELLKRLEPEGENEQICYAHGKGQSGTRFSQPAVVKWCDALYRDVVRNPNAVDMAFNRGRHTAGIFRKDGKFRGTDWHFSGSFYWMRSSELFQRSWRSIADDRWGSETYPGKHFRRDESFSFNGDFTLKTNMLNDRLWKSTLTPSLQNQNVVIASYFTFAPDPQRGGSDVWPADPNRVKKLVDSVTRHGVRCVILNDCFPSREEGLVSFVRVNPDTRFVTNVARRFAERDWIRQNRPLRAFVTDSTDVEMLRNPFEYLSPGRIYAGHEPGRVNCKWMRKNRVKSIGDYEQVVFDQHGHRRMFNPGVLGGFTDDMLSLFDRLTADHEQFTAGCPTTTDMTMFHYVLFKHGFAERLVTAPEVPVASEYKKYETDSKAWFKHK